jgi:membrane-associated HD superfamily phosphohydrolase
MYFISRDLRCREMVISTGKLVKVYPTRVIFWSDKSVYAVCVCVCVRARALIVKHYECIFKYTYDLSQKLRSYTNIWTSLALMEYANAIYSCGSGVILFVYRNLQTEFCKRAYVSFLVISLILTLSAVYVLKCRLSKQEAVLIWPCMTHVRN